MSRQETTSQGGPRGKALAALALGALGVVYGDIGTSPLYALKECFLGPHHVPVTQDNILGVLSLIFWSLNILISYKYVSVMMRADNRGEGGILALMALLGAGKSARMTAIFVVGLFGAALLYGDGVITPAISVLGAIEGLKVATPVFEPWVVWISVAILLALFLVQKGGTGFIGRMFGPVTSIWFICITAFGLLSIIRAPDVLAAVNPAHAVRFFTEHGLRGIMVLASVVLVVTGGEALYADMGHFGKRPIRVAWFLIVLPALLVNYFGQGALLLREPSAVDNPFFRLVPAWFLYPMVAIACGAAITASQALISGSFSLTQQAVQLGFSPRVTIRHTSSTEAGQIYIPEVNTLLGIACIGLVLAFQSSTNLAATYGVAVTGTMTITTILFSGVARRRWRWPWWKVVLTSGPLLAVDLAFASGNWVKIPEGGWFPLVLAAVVFALMSTWKRGRMIVRAYLRDGTLPLDLFVADIARRGLPRVPGSAVFMTSDQSGAPPVLLHHLKHNKMLHERVLVMSLLTEEGPYVESERRVEVKDFGEGIWQVTGHYGFMETPNMPELLSRLPAHGLDVKASAISFYLGRETLIPTGPAKLAGWRKRLFVFM
ncbi:MAG: trkD, partial [Gemmatimonadetes bacterium]|nr:trkD [Gemmatimonadota bacterium]